MKNNSIFKNLLKTTAILALCATVISCKKNDVDESGTANIRIVNASSSSSAQSFYLANSAVVNGGLTFGQNSSYIAFSSGNNLEAQFRNEGSSTAYATGKFNLDNGSYYTIFLAGDGQQARVKMFPDDLSPVSGSAKVRFIHLSDAAPSNIDIRRGSGENLAVNLGINNASNYITLAPGVLSLNIYATGQSTSLANFNLSSFAAGKVYTVYISGATSGSVSIHQITDN